MSNRNSHTGKSYQEKETYKRYLSKKDYEPTVNESLDFRSTEKPGEDLTEPSVTKKRAVSFNYAVSEHLKENWIKYLIAGCVIIGVFLVYDSRLKFELFDYKLSDIKDISKKIEKKLKNTRRSLLKIR